MRTALCLFWFGLLTSAATAQPADLPFVSLTNWEYRWSDSPVSADAPGWAPLPDWPRWPSGQPGQQLWLRTRLPSTLPRDPALRFDEVPDGLELFVAGQ